MRPPHSSGHCGRMSDGLRPGPSRTSSVAAGDPLPANCELIEVHVSELKQLFNAIDPSPFRERDLDPHAEEFITGWAKEASPGVAFGLAVYLDRPAGLASEPAEVREAIRRILPSPRGAFRDVGSASSFGAAGREPRHRRLHPGRVGRGRKPRRERLQQSPTPTFFNESLPDRRVGRDVAAPGSLPL